MNGCWSPRRRPPSTSCRAAACCSAWPAATAPLEYPLFGRDFHARGTAFREGVETLRAAWRGGPLELPRAGLGADRQLEVLPKPVHTTGIPIAIAGGAQQTPEWIAEHADTGHRRPQQAVPDPDDAVAPGGRRRPGPPHPAGPQHRQEGPGRAPGEDGHARRRPCLIQPAAQRPARG
ncbi:LLM class flavin-dependent oxidoreductase [Streptomyces spiralis]|uniref:LLM class flavin-dependent oxidoreductase n=1 Tax=Streptomyces spiralis TaxID=66376 RepID=UPI00369AE2E6